MAQVLGYLNFSSGATDTKFLANLNQIFRLVSPSEQQSEWQAAIEFLQTMLTELERESSTFRDASQARSILELVRDHVVPCYFAFHADLLFHQSESSAVNAFFLGRVIEAVLLQGGPWDESTRIADAAISHLNDYIGYRPVATLESQKIEPYTHEWVRPIPVYLQTVGAVTGPYEEVINATIRLLADTDEDLLHEACCHLDHLQEMAIDPRAYDFDHPVNKRPNYHFGQWDPHQIDNRGFYTRYVIQQVTLDALMDRIADEPDVPRDQLLMEAAAVLAGTIIMSTGISGVGPGSHHSTVNLSTLLPKIAGYRDEFYSRLLDRMDGEHGKRLQEEAAKRRQPFGGARQHLNASLARRRASQLEHVHLAAIFARMGYAEQANAEANIVPAASARMLCQIDCRLTAGDLAVAHGDLDRAAHLLSEIMDWVRRGIDCGAIIDPWNILGFDANFSLFPALENSVRDHRADELVGLMEQVFALYAKTWSEAAAKDEQSLCRDISQQFHETAEWWRKFAAHEVSSVEAVDVDDAYHAAAHVADALNLWHKGGAAVEDVAFWTPHADIFNSPKAFALVIDALLERHDFVASMALLIYWLGQSERIGLEKGDTSFFATAERWMLQLRRAAKENKPTTGELSAWRLARKFLDYLEANAEEYWHVPAFELGGVARSSKGPELLSPDNDDEDWDDDREDMYDAAYEEMVYIDSTDDGIDSELADDGQASDDEMVAESRRLNCRLAFLSCVARLWQLAVTMPRSPDCPRNDYQDVIRRWIDQAVSNRHEIHRLLNAIDSHAILPPSGDHDSMIEYDRSRLVKETMLEQVISTSVEIADAKRFLLAAICNEAGDAESLAPLLTMDRDQALASEVFAAILRGKPDDAACYWDDLIDALMELPLLYVPLARNGDPHRIVLARVRQRMIQDLLAVLPRVGLVAETCELIETAREMEKRHTVGQGAVTEFDELFKIGYKSLVKLIVHSAPSWQGDGGGKVNEALVDCLKQLTQSLMSSWLAHSKTLRLSVLEKVKDKREWNKSVQFIQTYGAEIFTQRFLNLANVRAILYQGTADWLEQLMSDLRHEVDWRLLDDIEDGRIQAGAAADQLAVILEAIAENYGEYRDYNSMTTQSDRGELLYTLLDFLRLRTKYDRLCWQLKPVVWAHEILVRRNRKKAARMWRRELTEQTSQQSAVFLEKLATLQARYAMRMPTVADRLGERFTRSMAIDRIRALVRPAIREAREGGEHPMFDLLKKETEELTRNPSGVGLDVPAWLVALEEEVEAASHRDAGAVETSELDAFVSQCSLPLDEIRRQLDQWSE